MSDYSGPFWIINSQLKYDNFLKCFKEDFDKYHWLKVKYTTGKTRTGRQNDTLHAWFRDVALALNAAGIDYQHFFTRFDFEFTENSVKDHIWRPVQKAKFGTESTTELERPQVSEVYDIINRKLADHGIFVPFGEEHEI